MKRERYFILPLQRRHRKKAKDIDKFVIICVRKSCYVKNKIDYNDIE